MVVRSKLVMPYEILRTKEDYILTYGVQTVPHETMTCRDRKTKHQKEKKGKKRKGQGPVDLLCLESSTEDVFPIR